MVHGPTQSTAAAQHAKSSPFLTPVLGGTHNGEQTLPSIVEAEAVTQQQLEQQRKCAPVPVLSGSVVWGLPTVDACV